jgi:hypothetical protein
MSRGESLRIGVAVIDNVGAVVPADIFAEQNQDYLYLSYFAGAARSGRTG